jgi:malonyl-ACP O-methyltransferase BioC
MANAKNVIKKPSQAYNQFGHIQDQIAAQLATRLHQHYPDLHPKSYLDIGCGTGFLTLRLSKMYPNATQNGLDPNPHFLADLKSKLPPCKAINMSLEMWTPTETYDLIVSSSALQWINNPGQNLQKLIQSVSPKGIFMAAIFGPKTYQELQSILDFTLASTTFPDATTWKKYLTQNLGNIQVSQSEIRIPYPSLRALLTAIKSTQTVGSGDPIKSRWTPQFLKALEKKYHEKYGQIWATHHLIWIEVNT